MKKEKPIYLWKSLQKGTISNHNNFKWCINKWYKINGKLEMCINGFHASEMIVDAMKYCELEVLAKVEVRSCHLKQDDKQCWEEMRIVKKWKWTKEDSVRLAIYAANLTLKNFEIKNPDDKRPRLAIYAAKNYLKAKNKAADSARSAAYSAADSAAYSAAGSADLAAYSAAAHTKIRQQCQAWIIRHLKGKAQ